MIPAGNDTITIQVILGDTITELTTYTGEYRNVMALLRDKMYLEGFGECGGVGRCGTCMVELLNAGAKMERYERNEGVTIARSGLAPGRLRLSCQLLVDHRINDLQLKIIT